MIKMILNPKKIIDQQVYSLYFQRFLKGSCKNTLTPTLLITRHLFRCGYKQGFSAQYVLIKLIESWIHILDQKGCSGVLMDLSKVFDTLNHGIVMAKLDAYVFRKESLKLIFDYFSDRFRRARICGNFSS